MLLASVKVMISVLVVSNKLSFFSSANCSSKKELILKGFVKKWGKVLKNKEKSIQLKVLKLLFILSTVYVMSYPSPPSRIPNGSS